MKLKNLFADDNAVSPVIGVILMVAITVILAAVIGTFVLGLGDQLQETSPTASFATDYTNSDEDELEISHDGGDSITTAQVTVVISGATDTDGDPNGDVAISSLGISSDEITAGSTAVIDEVNLGLDTNDDLDLSTATVKVTWTSESGDKSATLAKWSGPDA